MKKQHKTILDVVYAAIKAKDISKEVKEELIKEYLYPKTVWGNPQPIVIKEPSEER